VAGLQVLIVEDNEKNMKLFRDVLMANGHRTLEATTGGQAVEVAIAHAPDLVLMDLQLPGIDGTETLRRLRGAPGAREVPVVAVTAFAMQADRDRAFANGFDGFIEKPINVRGLQSEVARFLGKARP